MKPISIVLSPTRSRPLNIFLGLILLLASLLLLLSLATWHASDPSLNTATDMSQLHPVVHNWVGLFGAWLGDLLLQSIGISAFFLPVWSAGLGWTWMQSQPGGSPWLRWTGTLLALTFVPAVLGLLPWHWRWLHLLPVEGVLGRLVSSILIGYVNIQGAWLIAGILAGTGLYFASAVSFMVVKESVLDRWIVVQALNDRFRNWREERAERKAESVAQRAAEQGLPLYTEPEPEPDAPGGKLRSLNWVRPSRLANLFRRNPVREDYLDNPAPEDIPAFQRASMPAPGDDAQNRKPSIWERTAAEPPIPQQGVPILRPHSAGLEAVAPPAREEIPVPIQPYSPRQDSVPAARTPMPARAAAAPELPLSSARGLAAEASDTPNAALRTQQAVPAPVRQPDPISIHGRADAETRSITVAPKHVSGFKLPPSTLLHAGDAPIAVKEEMLREEARTLVEKCAEFDVRGQVVQINTGPMVTTYEFKPEAGVKYSRVTGLADDLCLAMRAESILIERMPGKSTVGIQVPNHDRETIHLRDVLESETFAKSKARLTIAMGKDINGRIVPADLATMPHLLIAGSTGSGKSVAINAMIMSLLFRTTPAQVRLILVDPKRVELGMYEGIPHLLTPIITEPKLAANALRNAVREMERRLKLLASRQVRNIDQYNKLFEGSRPSLFDEQENNEPLPFIVIIIDELADLMMLDRANVEESITRLAQMARAVGIHLVLATQRPSVDVITGLIKANVPTRMSFRLATKVDSRTILDTNGAEALLGRGDMLFLPPGTSRLMRLHAPYVSEKETAAVVDFWKAQAQAEYVEGFLESPKDERVAPDGSNADPDENDPMFNDAVQLVFEFGKASTSLLQRRLRIGYGRAAHLIDLMERDGLVGPADGSRPRELLKAPGWLHEVPAAID
jgi:S-DNA-T family DNA segregation ATPase FtsK/SpoIIIE